MNEPAIKTENLSRDFGRKRALDGFSIEVPPGRIVALLGPNGAGKTTLLRVLMGLIEPTEGGAWVLGAPSRAQPAEVAARIANMGDGHDPPGWATLWTLENLQAGASRRFDGPGFRRFCAERGLKSGARFGTLSKGQKRWVLAGLALAADAELILMDEPADGLDPAARRDLYDRLRDAATNNEAAAMVSTHIINDIERVADDVAIIDDGRLVLYAALEDLREQIRQVEIPDAEGPVDLGPDVTLLGSIRRGDVFIGWARLDSLDVLTDEQLRRRTGPDATVRPVNLETIYLAVTRHRSGEDETTKQETDR